MPDVVLWSNTSTDITTGVPFVFERLVQLAAPVMTLYQSNLFHVPCGSKPTLSGPRSRSSGRSTTRAPASGWTRTPWPPDATVTG